LDKKNRTLANLNSSSNKVLGSASREELLSSLGGGGIGVNTDFSVVSLFFFFAA
jgi:hypothetical protein